MKRCIKILLILVFMFSFVGTINVSAKNEINEGYLTVGMDCDYAPYSFVVSNGVKKDTAIRIENGDASCDGFDVLMASNIAKEMGLQLKISVTSFDGLIPALQANKIDVVMAGISPTEERKEVIDFSDSYYVSDTNYTVIVDKDKKYKDAKSISDLEGAKISAQAGTSHVDLINQISNGQEVQPQPEYITLMEQTKKGDIDGYIVEGPVADEQTQSDKQLLNLKLVNFDTGFEIDPSLSDVVAGFKKGNDTLKNEFNIALGKISDSKRSEYMTYSSEYNNTEIEKSKLQEFFDLLLNNKELFIKGTLVTLILAFLGTLFGVIFGCILAGLLNFKIHYKDKVITKISKGFVVGISKFYVLIFRGTPMMVQAMIMYYGIKVVSVSPLVIGILVISLNTAAYVSQIILGGIKAIDKGQLEAARSLGLSYNQAMFKVIVPQAFKNTIPSLANMLILNVKDTSVLNVISVAELFFAANSAASSSYNYLMSYIWAAIIYLVITMILTLILDRMFNEKHKKDTLSSGSEYETS